MIPEIGQRGKLDREQRRAQYHEFEQECAEPEGGREGYRTTAAVILNYGSHNKYIPNSKRRGLFVGTEGGVSLKNDFQRYSAHSLPLSSANA